VIRRYLTLVLTFVACGSAAQMTPPSSSGSTANAATSMESQSDIVQVPQTIRLSGRLKSAGGTAGGVAGVTFFIYSQEEGGVPLWTETQDVQLDASGRYSVVLGRMVNALPLDIFVSGNARWVEVVSDGYMETPRMQIVSVPYALRASNADMLGGRPASDFALVQQPGASMIGADPRLISWPISRPIPIPGPIAPITQTSKAWAYESTTPQGPSFISDATTGPPFMVNSRDLVLDLNVDMLQGLPATAFAQLGATNTFSVGQVFQAGITFPPTSQAQSGNLNGYTSSGLDLVASAFNTATSKPQSEDFRWQAESVGSNSTNPSGRLSLLFGLAGNPMAETGFSFNPDGTANLAPGQQFPLASIQGALSAVGLLDPVTGGLAQTPIVNTSSYLWQQIPASGSNGSSANKTAIQVGANTVTLNPCPNGVNGNDVWHYLYISGSGTPEAVLITGGSCTSGAHSGTIEFSAANAHPSGYSIGTATAGVQEAVIAAAIPQSNGTRSRSIQMSPGTQVFNARLSIRTSLLTLSGTGTTVVCSMQDTCIMLGDPSNANLASGITLESVTISPNIPRGAWPAVEDNAQASVIDRLGGAGTVKGNSFKSLIQIDNDQSAQINSLNTNLGSWSLCDSTYCSTAIVGSGPAGSNINAGVIWVNNSTLQLECAANGIDNQDGNTLHVLNSVVEAYPEFGIRSEGTYSNNPTVELTNVYTEIGNCISPLGTGMAGLIVENGFAEVTGSVGPNGELPQFSASGTIPLAYYVVVRSSEMGVSPVYLAGQALSDGTTGVPVKWNQVGTAGVITYDVLRISQNPLAYASTTPFGTGNFAVATGLTTANCSNMVCSFVDNPAASPSSYTVLPSLYSPALTLWPAGVVLTTRWDTPNNGGAVPTKYVTDTLTANSFVNSEGGFQPSVFAQECDPIGSWSPIWMQCQGGNGLTDDNPAILGTLIQMGANGGNSAGLKGRTIYELPTESSSIPGTELITLGDSNSNKTMATPGNRPSWDSNDTYLGLDQVSNAIPQNFQLALGAPVSISSYIASVPNGTNWRERLTASLKSFSVPVTAPAYWTSSDCASAAGICGTASAGKITIAPGATSVTVSTTLVTANSEIHIDENFSYGSVLAVSCNTNLARHYAIAAQWPGVGFSVITDVPPNELPACLSFSIEN
jgi:hypothetical protein